MFDFPLRSDSQSLIKRELTKHKGHYHTWHLSLCKWSILRISPKKRQSLFSRTDEGALNSASHSKMQSGEKTFLSPSDNASCDQPQSRNGLSGHSDLVIIARVMFLRACDSTASLYLSKSEKNGLFCNSERSFSSHSNLTAHWLGDVDAHARKYQ